MSDAGGGGYTREKCLAFLAGTEHAGTDARLAIAIAAAERAPREAIDLGCGAGHEAVAMLKAGFRVHAVDAFAEAVDATRARAERSGVAGGLSTRVERMERIGLNPVAPGSSTRGSPCRSCPDAISSGSGRRCARPSPPAA